MLILNEQEIRQVLPMSDAIEAMKQALVILSNGTADVPLRTHVGQDHGTTLVMPGLVHGKLDGESFRSLIVKVVSIFNQNAQRDLPNIMGVINVLDPDTGQPLALLNAAIVTAIRTAATSAAATDVLANPDASRLAIVGAGIQARSHFEAICAVRKIKRATFYGPTRSKVESLLAGLETEVELVVAESSAEATKDADIVCTTTNASNPVIEDAAIKPGCHVNAIGSYKPNVVEIPEATVLRSRIYVDHLDSALQEAGDLIQPIEAGTLQVDQIICQAGRLWMGDLCGRQSVDDVTLFKSVGNTVQDVVAAHVIVQNAKRSGLGRQIDF